MINPFVFSSGDAFSPAVNGKMPVAAWIPTRTQDATDILGGFNGTLTSGASVVSAMGSSGTHAFNFDGANDYVNVPTAIPMTSWSGATYSLWVNPDDDSSNQIVFSHLHSGGDDIGFIRINGNSGDVSMTLDDGTRVSSGPVLITAGEWTHIVGTFDGSTAKLYRNGVLVLSFTDTFNFSTSTSGFVSIGSRGGAFPFGPGNLDDIRIWSQALDSTDIAALATGRGVNVA